MTEKEHQCTFDDPKRLGRAHYVCRICGKDITMELVFMHMAGVEGIVEPRKNSRETTKKNKKKKT